MATFKNSAGTVYIYNRSPYSQNFNTSLFQVLNNIGDNLSDNSKLGYTVVASYIKNDPSGKSTVYAGAPFNSIFSSDISKTLKSAPYLSGGTVLVASTIPSQNSTTSWLEYFKNGTTTSLLNSNDSANLGLQINLASNSRGGAIYSAPDISNQNNKEGVIVDRAAVIAGNGTVIVPALSSNYTNFGVSTYVDRDSKYCLSLAYKKSDNKPVIFLHDFQGAIGESNNSIVINGDNNSLHGSYGLVAGNNNVIRELTFNAGSFGNNNIITPGLSSTYIFGSNVIANKTNTVYLENIHSSLSARVEGDVYTANLNLEDKVLITPNVETTVFSVTALNEFLEIKHQGKTRYLRLHDISTTPTVPTEILTEIGETILTEDGEELIW
jgi:hypothetical protein